MASLVAITLPGRVAWIKPITDNPDFFFWQGGGMVVGGVVLWTSEVSGQDCFSVPLALLLNLITLMVFLPVGSKMYTLWYTMWL